MHDHPPGHACSPPAAPRPPLIPSARSHRPSSGSPAQLIAEADPAWPNGQAPAIEEAEARIAQLNSDIHASAVYRAHLCNVVARKAVAAAG